MLIKPIVDSFFFYEDVETEPDPIIKYVNGDSILVIQEGIPHPAADDITLVKILIVERSGLMLLGHVDATDFEDDFVAL
jgi:hypothetical protein